MAGIVAAAVTAGSAELSFYSAQQSNKAADRRAAAANANNAAAAEQSRLAAAESNKLRQSELLRRFKINAGKVKDTVKELEQSTALKLTTVDMSILKAKSVTDNTMASKHIEGRLAERLQNTIDIQKDMAKGNIVQATEADIKSVNSKLENMVSNLESQQMNVDIDFSNAINQANNNEIRGITFSSSTGMLGAINAGVGGAMQGMSAVAGYYGMKNAMSTAATAQTTSNINYGGTQ